ncbi:uncharacterized protein CC84DRAFT_1205492 [Paraphaeosphaeria sporulosa]|uniref:HTH psq-type domain-containing protein n=1 Tax=Paraphaeosphaeria sporulosa TaxID=1460663 RepID=A0A177CDS3_9PLEO|nr:uncharacterized protein CC84DRAFT_1205492 [Paraphaeosphaeria sporulosa]OAG05784.1 hypothetical protein CC84DRAFT_1205492 [Paraphaeosphaeria sporulosa]
MDPIQAAINDIESLQPGESFSYSQMARKHHVVRSTLSRRHQGITQSRAVVNNNRQNINQQQEKEVLRDQSIRRNTSVLSASDWRKFERLLCSAVKGLATEESYKLSQTLHSISIQNQLLEHENKCLREALATQKRSSNVQRAHDRQHERDIEEQQIQLQKSEQAEARRASKKLKERLLQERRIARAAARDARAKQRADEAADRRLKQQARKAQRQLQNRIKLSKKSNEKVLKPSSRSIEKTQAQREAVDVDEASSVASASQSRRGRIIKKPSRYRSSE